MKKCQNFLLLFSIFFLFSLKVIGSEKREETDFNNKGYQRHLDHDIPYMKINTDYYKKLHYDYIVDDEVFNKIHPPIHFDDAGYNLSACRVKCPNKTVGSGTIISISKSENNEIRSEIITAKHVVEDKVGNVMFPLIEQGLTTFSDGRSAYLAKHEIEEVCYKRGSVDDIALLKGVAVENNYDDLFSTPSQIRSRKLQNKEILTEVYGSHYPFGTSTQRLNFGIVNPDGTHGVGSLPGSSGFGLHNSNKELSWVHSAGGRKTDKKVLYDVSFLNRPPERIYNIAENNISYPIFKEDIREFKDCVKKNFRI